MNSTALTPADNNTEFAFDNVDPGSLSTSDTINAVFVVDESPSVRTYIHELTKAYNDTKNKLATTHVKDQLLVSTVEFSDRITRQSGFQPIVGLPDAAFAVSGDSTALYRSTLAALKNAMAYRENLEDSGINCKTLLFVISDGMDMDGASGRQAAQQVNDMIKGIMAQESNFNTFTAIFFGIGPNRAPFEEAKDLMGFQHLGVITDTPEQIRSMVDFISASISSAGMGQAQSAPNF